MHSALPALAFHNVTRANTIVSLFTVASVAGRGLTPASRSAAACAAVPCRGPRRRSPRSRSQLLTQVLAQDLVLAPAPSLMRSRSQVLARLHRLDDTLQLRGLRTRPGCGPHPRAGRGRGGPAPSLILAMLPWGPRLPGRGRRWCIRGSRPPPPLPCRPPAPTLFQPRGKVRRTPGPSGGALRAASPYKRHGGNAATRSLRA